MGHKRGMMRGGPDQPLAHPLRRQTARPPTQLSHMLYVLYVMSRLLYCKGVTLLSD